MNAHHNGNKDATVRLWADGHSYKTIAAQLRISPHTVKEYLDRTRAEYAAAGEDATGRANLLALLRRDGRS